MRDPYECLAVSRSATADEIKQSFRLLAKMLHPDANNDPNAAAVFTELNAAHEILGDEWKRRAFDQGEIDAEGRPTRRVIARHSRTSTWHIVTSLLVVMVMLAVTSVLIIRGLRPEEKISSDVAANEEHAPVIPSERLGAGVWSESRLLFPQSVSYVATDTIRLGIQVGGETAGLAVEISGLTAGMTISAGRPQGRGRWRILATDVDNAMIYLPPGFSGAINLAVELRLFDDTVVDRGSLRLEWLQTAPIESAVATAISEGSTDKALATAAPTNQDAIRHATDAVAVSGSSTDKASATAALTNQNARQRAIDVTAISENSADKALATAAPADQNAMPHATDSQQDHEPIELLIRRSEKLLSEGEGEAARILLQPAADAHDALAVLALGATYDPIMLAKLQARGVPADASLALDWYKKAQELGSREAQRRLKLLAAALVEPKRRVVRPPIHVAVSHVAAPRVAAPVQDPNEVSVAGDHVAAVPGPNIRAQLSRNDASEKLRYFGVSY
jgi:hypothetical protein